MKINKKFKKLGIILGSSILSSSIITSLAVACSTSANKSNNTEVTNINETNEINKIHAGFDIDDLVIEPPKGDQDLRTLSMSYNNYNQPYLSYDEYYENYSSINQQTRQQENNPYEYLFIKTDKTNTSKKSVSLKDEDFRKEIIKLTPNTLLNDFYAFFEKVRTENQNAIFTYTKPEIEVYKLVDNQKVIIKPNQSIFQPLTQQEINNNISFEEKNKNIYIKLNFWMAFTNQRTNAILIKDPFTNKPRSISSNSSEKYSINIEDALFSLGFVGSNRIIRNTDEEAIGNEQASKLQYFFDKIEVMTQETTIRRQAKISDDNSKDIIVKPIQQHFVGDNNFVFGSGSYTFNVEYENTSFKDDIFNLDKQASQKIQVINKEQLLKDVRGSFESGYNFGLEAIKDVFDLLKSIYDDKGIKEIFIDNKNGINSLIKKITQNNLIANLAYKFVSNQSLGALIESFKPLIPKILDAVGVDKAIQKTILDRVSFMDFENNLIDEINKIIPLIDSISLAEIKKYRPLIIKVLDLVKVEQARSIRETPGKYGVIDFLDQLISLVLNLNENEIPNDKIIEIDNQKLGIADLIKQLKDILDLITPKTKENLNQETYTYKISEISILDLISLNTSEQLDYKLGIKKLLDFIKQFNLPIPQMIFNLIDDLLINNKNWNKENVKKIIHMILYPNFIDKKDERIVDFYTFVKYGIKKPQLLDENLVFDESKKEIENLRLVYKYEILEDVEFDISPIIDILPEESPRFLDLGSTWNQIKNEIPRKIYLASGDFVTMKLVVDNNQKLIPLIHKDLSIDKYKLGYSVYPKYEIDASLSRSITKIIANNKKPNETILPQKYLTQILSYIFYKRWNFSNALSIYKSIDDKGIDIIKNELDSSLKNFDPQTYRNNFSFNFNKNRLDEIGLNNISVKENILKSIRTIKLNEQLIETDLLGRETRIIKTNDVHNITLQRLIADKVLSFGSEVDLNKDVFISVTPLVFGFNTKTDSYQYEDNQEIKYDLMIVKKAIITLHFSKPVLNKSNNNELVYSFTFLI